MKNKKGIILGIIIGIIMTSGVGVLAAYFNAEDIAFTPNDSSWEVTNVKEAMDSLYDLNNSNATLLWSRGEFESNANDTGQTIEMDLTPYSKIAIKMRVSSTANNTVERISILEIGETAVIGVTSNTLDQIPSSNFHLGFRQFSCTTTGVTWGKAIDYNSVSQSNTDTKQRFVDDGRFAFPIEIYGIK